MRIHELIPTLFRLLLSFAIPACAVAATGSELLQANCIGCHTPDGEGRLSRIAEQRKTPEGWLMTLVRMQQVHQIPINALDSADPVQEMVKFLADTQGLAPSESWDYRYILERRLNTIEQLPDAHFAGMCSRCHTGARVGLQRRSEEEWRRLIHFHLGQFPSTEYSAGGRDRDWFSIALQQTVPWLAGAFPFESSAWEEWREAAKPVQTGTWRIIGSMPGRGDFQGFLEAVESSKDSYGIEFHGEFSDGESLQGGGLAIVYTGYEWRAKLTLGEATYQQVLAGSADGKTMQGRMYLQDHEETGMDIQLTRVAGNQLLAVSPSYVRAGASTRLRLSGFGLAGEISAGPGLQILSVTSRDENSISLEVQADLDASPGRRMISVGTSLLPEAVTVYPRIDYIKVQPELATARVGDNGGSQTPVNAAFEAWAWSNGADGQANTGDDISIGILPATWSVRAWDEVAERNNDVQYAGSMDSRTGVFRSAAAGPNPERPRGVNNFGNLVVVAEVVEGDGMIRGEAHLMVTVQRWNNPPIR